MKGYPLFPEPVPPRGPLEPGRPRGLPPAPHAIPGPQSHPLPGAPWRRARDLSPGSASPSQDWRPVPCAAPWSGPALAASRPPWPRHRAPRGGASPVTLRRLSRVSGRGDLGSCLSLKKPGYLLRPGLRNRLTLYLELRRDLDAFLKGRSEKGKAVDALEGLKARAG